MLDKSYIEINKTNMEVNHKPDVSLCTYKRDSRIAEVERPATRSTRSRKMLGSNDNITCQSKQYVMNKKSSANKKIEAANRQNHIKIDRTKEALL